MRILYILTSLGVGGAEKQVVGLAERMAQKGHVVSLLVLKHAEEEWPTKLPVLRLNLRKTPLAVFRGLRFARNFVVLFRPEILHSHTFPANLFTRLLARFLPPGGIRPRVVSTIHNEHEGGWHRMLLYRATDFLADRVTAVSAAAAQRSVERHAVPMAKMQILTNGIDTEAFAPNRARRKQMRAQMGVRMGTRIGFQNQFVWLAVGRLVPAKDYPNLLRAFDWLRTTHPEASLWIAGEGDPATLDGIGPVPPDPSIRFLGLRRDIPDLLDAADAYVLSSAWEGMPLAVGEAMSMEKLVVATDVGGVRELVGEVGLGQTGLIVPPKDHLALAAAMAKAMTLKEMERKTMASAARRRIQVYFSMDAKAAEWEQLYRRLLEGSGA